MTILVNLIVFVMVHSVHPFHVTVCEIEHSADAKTLQVSQRMFLDDLEKTLDEIYDVRLDILHPEDANKRDSLIKDYVLKHLLLTIEGKPGKRAYVGHEIEGDVLWCYIEYYNVKKLGKIDVTNTIFFDVYDDQNTIVHVKYNGVLKSGRLTRLWPTEHFEFNKAENGR